MGEKNLLNTHQGQRILAVDDEEEILKIYDVFLRHEGFEVVKASNAEQCMEELKKARPDLILLDVNMPGIDGLLLLEMIRASEVGREIPIMMISAKNDEQTITRAGALGCDSFVIKPFKLKELLKRINVELTQIDDAFVQRSLEIARVHRNSLLKQSGLSKFDTILWDCYPFSHEEVDFCLVVPRGIRPQAQTKLDIETLKSQTKVFCKYKGKWKQVWP